MIFLTDCNLSSMTNPEFCETVAPHSEGRDNDLVIIIMRSLNSADNNRFCSLAI